MTHSVIKAPAKSMAYSPLLASRKEFSNLLKVRGGYEELDATLMATTHITLMAIEERELSPYKGHIEGMILDGDPGVGKSFMAQAIAKAMDGRLLTHLGNPDADHSELLRGINPAEVVKAMAGIGKYGLDKENISEDEIYFVGKLLEAFLSSQDTFTVLLFDEAEKNRFAVQTALLTIIQDGEIPLPGKLLKEDGVNIVPNGSHSQLVRARRDNLLILMAKNKERDLYDATIRRFRVVYVDYPKRTQELKFLAEKFGSPELDETDLSAFDHLKKDTSTFGKNVKKTVLSHRTESELSRIVKDAAKLRRDLGITKKPSHPEVQRLTQDFIRLATYRVHIEPSRSKPGESIYRSEYDRTVLSALYLNGLTARQEEQERGKAVIGNYQGNGPGFLKNILRAMHEGQDFDLTYAP